MPCSAMQKLTVRNGCMLGWAWLPPEVLMVCGFIVVIPSGPGARYALFAPPGKLFAGTGVPPVAALETLT